MPLPDGTSFAEGACLGIPAMTAHRCVFADGPVEGKTILVTGGAGAVGHYAIQFARLGGARVIATVGSEDQARLARKAGAELAINRRETDIVAAVASFTGSASGRGVDRIVEVAFGANLETSLRLLNPNGVIATYASDAEPEPTLPFWPLVRLDATVRFVLVYAMSREAHEAAIDAIGAALAGGQPDASYRAKAPARTDRRGTRAGRNRARRRQGRARLVAPDPIACCPRARDAG